MALNLSAKTSILSQYLHELRDVEIQKDKRRFERNLERIAAILAYELSKQLEYASHETATPLGKIDTLVIRDKIVVATILRAGLPMQKGVASVFDEAEQAFVAAGRKSESKTGVEIDLSYVASGDLSDKTLIIADTMLATGHSIVDAHNALVQHGQPAKTFIVCAIASQPGLEYVDKNLPQAEILAAAVDPELNDKFYIVPGLGDAGDLLYGPKL